MSFTLKNNFFGNARCITYKDANGISWGINPNTNEITAAYSGAGSAGSANPTAKVGLTAVNGAAATFMTSDSAPPIDLTISPTWTGNHVFNPAAGTPLIAKLNGTVVFEAVGTAGPTVQAYGPTAAGLVDLTPDSGTAALTLTGCTTSPTSTLLWARVGNLVVLRIGAVTGTSNSTACTLTGLPSELTPAHGANILCLTENNSAIGVSMISISGTTITLFNGSSPTAVFTSSGTKGLPQSLTVAYALI